MKRDSESTRPLFKEGSKVLLKCMRGKVDDSEKIKVAISGCLLHIRLLATEANMEDNRLRLAKMIYTDPREMKKYISIAMPQMIERRRK
jgi:hypothetical protein